MYEHMWQPNSQSELTKNSMIWILIVNIFKDIKKNYLKKIAYIRIYKTWSHKHLPQNQNIM
jgi:hypothetical protein